MFCRKQRQRLHVPSQGTRGSQTGRACHAIVWIGQYVIVTRSRYISEEPDYSGIRNDKKYRNFNILIMFARTTIDFCLCIAYDTQRYAVIPLSTNSGLIGWVPHCDTLHTLIRDYREKKKILLNIEHRIMLRVSLSLSLPMITSSIHRRRF